MNYYALGELVMMTLMGLSVLVIAFGFSVRMFLAPTLREIFGKRDPAVTTELGALPGRLDRLEDRLDAIEGGLDRIEAAQNLDRQLDVPKIG